MKKVFIIAPVLLYAFLYFLLGGCSHDIKGPDRVNEPPEVNFVNIPVEGARFSSDTTLYWYGTDVDGYITMFRYVVLKGEVVGPDPEAVLTNNRTELLVPGLDSIGWINIDVSLEETGTKDRVKMAADVSDPVRTYISSYVFLQAIDNKGAKSSIVYRSFQKNNHFPRTFIEFDGGTFQDPFINAEKPGGLLPGMTIGWYGEDRLDYPLQPPPFEFRWKVFGPYTDEQIAELQVNYVCSVFVDNFGDFYQPGDTLRRFNRIDTTYNPDSTIASIDSIFNLTAVNSIIGWSPLGTWESYLLGINRSKDSLVLPEESQDIIETLHMFDGKIVDSSNGWTYNTSETLYDLFRFEDSDTTRQLNFVVWCVARDDAEVPDKTPAFDFVSVVDPKFERDVLLLDATNYNYRNSYNWPLFDIYPLVPAPDTSFMIRDVYAEYIKSWPGLRGDFDNVNIIPNDTIEGMVIFNEAYGTTQDYYAIRMLADPIPGEYGNITMRELMKHEIILIIKDDTNAEIELGSSSPEGKVIQRAIYNGMSAWIMARAPAGPGIVANANIPSMDRSFETYFGIESLKQTGWQSSLRVSEYRVEDFIGALALPGLNLPNLTIDTTLLETRYLWDERRYRFRDPETGEMYAGALPEVGYIRRKMGTEPLYLYDSKYGLLPPYYVERMQGTVVALRYETSRFKTALFGFTLIPLDPVTSQQMFNTMMDWLRWKNEAQAAGKL